MEGLLSLLSKETFDSFYSIANFEPDVDDPSLLLYGHIPSDFEHTQGVTYQSPGAKYRRCVCG